MPSAIVGNKFLLDRITLPTSLRKLDPETRPMLLDFLNDVSHSGMVPETKRVTYVIPIIEGGKYP